MAFRLQFCPVCTGMVHPVGGRQTELMFLDCPSPMSHIEHHSDLFPDTACHPRKHTITINLHNTHLACECHLFSRCPPPTSQHLVVTHILDLNPLLVRRS